jgi:hypothetical protein
MPVLAVLRVAFLGTVRSHGIRAAWALALLATLLAPLLVAFAFEGAGALAVEGALGSACLFAPAAALFAGTGFAAGDRGGEGLAPALRSAARPASVLAAAAAGIAAASALGTVAAALAGGAALAVRGAAVPWGPSAGALLAAACAAPPAAAAGLLLGAAVPRALAAALAALLLAGTAALPGAGPFLLARDAAFGPLPAAAVLLSCAASLLLAAAAVAAGVAVLRVKDLAPRAGPS